MNTEIFKAIEMPFANAVARRLIRSDDGLCAGKQLNKVIAGVRACYWHEVISEVDIVIDLEDMPKDIFPEDIAVRLRYFRNIFEEMQFTEEMACVVAGALLSVCQREGCYDEDDGPGENVPMMVGRYFRDIVLNNPESAAAHGSDGWIMQIDASDKSYDDERKSNVEGLRMLAELMEQRGAKILGELEAMGVIKFENE